MRVWLIASPSLRKKIVVLHMPSCENVYFIVKKDIGSVQVEIFGLLRSYGTNFEFIFLASANRLSLL